MQAQKLAPSDMHCKDKFLIQSTMAPFGTTEDQITPAMFAKDTHKYMEETKLRVVLATAPNSPAKPSSDVVLKQEASSYETVSPNGLHSPVLTPVNGFSKQGQSDEISNPKDEIENGVENNLPTDLVTNKVEAVKTEKITPESRSFKFNIVDDMMSVSEKYPVKQEVFVPEKDEDSKKTKDSEEIGFKLTQEIEELRSKISSMGTKLAEAQKMIEKLNKEKSIATHEKETVMQQLAMLKTRSGGTGTGTVARKVHIGFPPLFVCMVALISLMLGLIVRV
ncbi:vesicle-associated protein 2-2-like isoform X2 [Andrographis paniculata]|nr:vesicle-associated protein 2-2-like isoform X2 [Andrographis paniculata]XP_051127221.1 vesicle-associated protein 2-2-like isoform X2 [Andrographis paniculata]